MRRDAVCVISYTRRTRASLAPRQLVRAERIAGELEVAARLRLRARVRAGPCVLAFAFACAPSVAMFPLGRAMLYSRVRARYMCLRSGRGSDVNVYNV